MTRKAANCLAGALFLITLGLLAAPSAGAGTANGKLGVGIVILDACRLDPAAASPLTPIAGFSLKCAKGTDYTFEVSAAGQPHSDHQPLASVTVRF